MILLIDNYDSFTYNLAQVIGTIAGGHELRIVRNDKISATDVARLRPSHIILSPGPCTPAEAGVCNDVIPALRGQVPILGVCLGHQCIGATHGMRVRRADTIMHGKTSEIHHDGRGIFAGVPNPFTATRYHSLIVDRETIAPEFVVSAWTTDGTVMGLRWEGGSGQSALEGVQFHPESFLTTEGPKLIANFLGVTSGG